MTKISLRVYNREIEAMIESGQVDEAIAHCKNILKTYPKHLESYRLLGKAFLEKRRYSDAADIFKRVLMAVPEDFVSHVGMSIIRDDEKKLDEAIWHMERAFEVQPSNPAIQDELRKLYGRRDGVQPPKVRLTRDALANMYTQGALYSQAIAEIRAVLADDPNRPDLQVMLARAYSRDGRKKQAIEICTELLKNFPYCFDALRILIDLMPPTDQQDFTETYRLRVKSLDPYSEFATGSIFNSDNVPDAAIELEHLDYNPIDFESGSQIGWPSSQGINMEPEDEQQEVPDLLSEELKEIRPESEGQEQAHAMDVEANGSSDIEDIPDWMRSSGWEESSDQTIENAGFKETEDATDESLAKADIPEWLKDMAPDEETIESEKLPDGFESMLDGNFIKSPLDDNLIVTKQEPDLIEDIIGNDISEKEILHLEEDTETAESILAATASTLVSHRMDTEQDGSENISSGESEVESDKIPAQPFDDIYSAEDEVQQEVKSGENELRSPGDNVDDLPDWLKDIGPEAQDDDTKNTISELSSQPVESISNGDQDFPKSEANNDAELPDWLKEVDSTQEEISIEDELDATLETGSEIHFREDSVEEPPNLELISEPEELVDKEDNQTQIKDAPILESGSVNEELPSADDQGETLAWLESLAAKQEIKPEEILTTPEDRLEDTPEGGEKSTEDETRSIEEETKIFTPTEPGLVEKGNPDERIPILEGDTEATDFKVVDEQSQVFESNEQVEIVEDSVIPSNGLDNYPDASFLDEAEYFSEESPSVPDGQPSKLMDENSLEEAFEYGQPEVPDSEIVNSPESDVSEWLKGLDGNEAYIQEEPMAPEVSESFGSETTEPLPDWLKEIETKTSSSEWISESEGLPEPYEGNSESELISNEKRIDEKEEIIPTETSKLTIEDSEPESDLEPLGEAVKPVESSDWQPAHLESDTPVSNIPEISEPESTQPSGESDQSSEPQGPRTLSKIPTKDIEKEASNLEKAQSLIDSGEFKEAMEVYGKLIKKGQSLEGVIHDLRETTDRYPSEIGIWQLLGDAYMRANRLQDALDAYIRAEEMLR
ncbi:MAG: tetratricopeptide repeat protein [Chloroflexota bacterium]